jgi:hypothetical protein
MNAARKILRLGHQSENAGIRAYCGGKDVKVDGIKLILALRFLALLH